MASKVIRTTYIDSAIEMLKYRVEADRYKDNVLPRKLANIYMMGYRRGLSVAIEAVEAALEYRRPQPVPQLEKDLAELEDYVKMHKIWKSMERDEKRREVKG